MFVATVIAYPLMRLSDAAAVITSFALLVVMHTIMVNWSEITNGPRTLFVVPKATTLYMAAFGAILAILIALLFQESRSELLLRAVRDDEISAGAMGTNLSLLRWRGFVLSALFAGFTGGLRAHFITSFQPSAFYLKETFVILGKLIIALAIIRPRRSQMISYSIQQRLHCLLLMCKAFISSLQKRQHSVIHEVVIPNIATLIEKSRAQGLEIMCARITYLKDDGRDRSLSQKKPGWNYLLLPKDADDSSIAPVLQPQGDEIVLYKTTDSAVTGTKMRIKNVVVVGIFTDQCISSAVRSLADKSFNVVVVEDCCVAATKELHDHELEIINMIYCHVVSSEEVASVLKPAI